MKNFQILNKSLKKFKIDQLIFSREDKNIIFSLLIGKQVIDLGYWINDDKIITATLETDHHYNVFKLCDVLLKPSALLTTIKFQEQPIVQWFELTASCDCLEELMIKQKLLSGK